MSQEKIASAVCKIDELGRIILPLELKNCTRMAGEIPIGNLCGFEQQHGDSQITQPGMQLLRRI